MDGPRRSCFVLLLARPSALGARAARIKDVTVIEGSRDNQLVGYGMVAGLAGDGDSNSNGALHVVANILQRYGIAVSVTDLKTKNVAAVMVTADIAAFLKPGARIDVTVSSMGDAKSLQRGGLHQTPLLGADGRTYAVAQGAIAIGGFLGGVGGPGGATVQKNHPTVGAISNGAIVERGIPSEFVHDDALRPALRIRTSIRPPAWRTPSTSNGIPPRSRSTRPRSRCACRRSSATATSRSSPISA